MVLASATANRRNDTEKNWRRSEESNCMTTFWMLSIRTWKKQPGRKKPKRPILRTCILSPKVPLFLLVFISLELAARMNNSRRKQNSKRSAQLFIDGSVRPLSPMNRTALPAFCFCFFFLLTQFLFQKNLIVTSSTWRFQRVVAKDWMSLKSSLHDEFDE